MTAVVMVRSTELCITACASLLLLQPHNRPETCKSLSPSFTLSVAESFAGASTARARTNARPAGLWPSCCVLAADLWVSCILLFFRLSFRYCWCDNSGLGCCQLFLWGLYSSTKDGRVASQPPPNCRHSNGSTEATPTPDAGLLWFQLPLPYNTLSTNTLTVSRSSKNAATGQPAPTRAV